MKTIRPIWIVLVTIFLGACSGSETYRGSWKATNEEGTQLEILFNEKDFSITEDQKIEKFDYSQNAVNIRNSVETYGIQLGDGRSFQIYFPIPDDESKGAILDAQGEVLYIISRTDYLGYDDVFGL